MAGLKAFACDTFRVPLPEWHRFPMAKYALLRERVEGSGLVALGDLRTPRAATEAELLRAHAPEYVERVRRGTLTPDEVRYIGFPWTLALVERSRRSVGGTIEAALAALDEGVAVNLAGGTHHAFRDKGGGYCIFNDAAVAARALQAEGRIERALIVDCDVHQGDGTASIFADDPTVFTFSIHGESNYPPVKPPSDLDVGLDDGTRDEAYLAALSDGLDRAIARAGAGLAFYLAGADPFIGDRLGRLKVTKDGLAARDRMVFDRCRAAGLPVAVAMAGGYAEDVADTVDIHFATVREAAAARAAGAGPAPGSGL